MSYDPNNIFAKILRAEIPCSKVYEDDAVLAFKDINPKGPVHVLVIPKGNYVSFVDFCDQAGADAVSSFFQTVTKISHELGLNEQGFRLVSNVGPDSGQEVPHFHVHLIGGKRLGPMA
jgi:histidine triad (HIT) family protein